MDRRRGAPARPASSEEIDCWTHAKQSLSTLSSIYLSQTSTDTILRVNRLISTWPTDDTLPAEGIDSIKTLSKKLSSGLEEIAKASEREAKAIEAAIEQLGILVALRKAPEALPADTMKRNKRPRAATPQVAQGFTSNGASNGRGVSITLPARNSVGPTSAVPFSREPKARREALAKQLPLQEGRKVAFHPHGQKSSTTGQDTDENTWILAVVTRCINADKNRYEVQDAEPQEDGGNPVYNTTLRSIIPLPDPHAPPSSASSLSAYQEFSKGSTVMALYPDTSCFYRAEVIHPPSNLGKEASGVPTYKLKFEDDDDNEHHVAAQWVVEWPGP